MKGKKHYAGCFAEQSAAEHRARELWREHGAPLEAEIVEVVNWLKEQKSQARAAVTDENLGSAGAELPSFQPPENVPGIHWMPSEQCWKAEPPGSAPKQKTSIEDEKQEAREWLERQKRHLASDSCAVKAMASPEGQRCQGWGLTVLGIW
eukprot:s604_g4.t1